MSQDIADNHEMKCPSCGKADSLDIAATIDTRLTSEGSDVDESRDGSHIWESSNAISCGCGWAGRVWEATEAYEADNMVTDPDREDIRLLVAEAIINGGEGNDVYQYTQDCMSDIYTELLAGERDGHAPSFVAACQDAIGFTPQDNRPVEQAVDAKAIRYEVNLCAFKRHDDGSEGVLETGDEQVVCFNVYVMKREAETGAPIDNVLDLDWPTLEEASKAAHELERLLCPGEGINIYAMPNNANLGTSKPITVEERSEAAACLWEAMQGMYHNASQCRAGARSGFQNRLCSEFEKNGTVAMRMMAISWADECHYAFVQEQVQNGYDDPFDWEFVPRWLYNKLIAEFDIAQPEEEAGA